MIKKLFVYLKIDTTWIDSCSKFNRHGACAECNLPPKHLLDGHSQDLRYSQNWIFQCFNQLDQDQNGVAKGLDPKWYLWN